MGGTQVAGTPVALQAACGRGPSPRPALPDTSASVQPAITQTALPLVFLGRCCWEVGELCCSGSGVAVIRLVATSALVTVVAVGCTANQASPTPDAVTADRAVIEGFNQAMNRLDFDAALEFFHEASLDEVACRVAAPSRSFLNRSGTNPRLAPAEGPARRRRESPPEAALGR